MSNPLAHDHPYRRAQRDEVSRLRKERDALKAALQEIGRDMRNQEEILLHAAQVTDRSEERDECTQRSYLFGRVADDVDRTLANLNKTD